jgi:hypothetical protein
MTFDLPLVGEDFFVVTDVEARAVEPRLGATNDNASDRSIESDEAAIMQINFKINQISTAEVG